MLYPLDLKTVFLICGDFNVYLPKQTNKYVSFKDISIAKDILKIIETDSYKSRLNDGKIIEHTHLCQIENLKVYLIITSVNASLMAITNTETIDAFYCDSKIDAINFLHKKNQELEERFNVNYT